MIQSRYNRGSYGPRAKGWLRFNRDIVRLWCADAAGDEQLAGREAGPLSGSLAPFFPNLELVLRDTAHASRRLIEFSV